SNGHGFVLAIYDIGKFDWGAATKACRELVINGYSDWELPNNTQMDLIYKGLHLNRIGHLKGSGYWCKMLGGGVASFSFDGGWQVEGKAYPIPSDSRDLDPKFGTLQLHIRPVRFF
ncbi:MAG: hypothetical protein ACKOAV_01655, partial [Bacteroidota bacterium]